MKHRKDVIALLKRAQTEGAEVVKVPNGHWKVTNPDTGESFQCSYSPKSPSVVFRIAKDLKRIGYLT